MKDLLPTLRALLSGSSIDRDAVSPALRLEFDGRESLGVAGVAARLAADPVTLTPTPHVVRAPSGLAVLDWDHAGRAVAVFADLREAMITRLWRIDGEPSAASMRPEPGASARVGAEFRNIHGFDLGLHPDLETPAGEALADLLRMHRQGARPTPVVVRAFGGDGRAAALLALGRTGAPASASGDYVVVACRYDDSRLLHLVTVPRLHSYGPAAPGIRP